MIEGRTGDGRGRTVAVAVWAALAAGVVQVGVGAAVAASVEPEVVVGNPDCRDLGLEQLAKFDPPTSGSQNGVTIAVSGSSFGWTSSTGVDAVIAKGGPNANVYRYDEATSDSDLHAPINPRNGQP
ncbi:MAG: hypothetical protein KatS3mg014_1363 [Actinomycetota bacterium]|nr:MAG: hypothetical protein KatS3mg014_1363 [Actinomycetota bacterium]